jgi:hypothetical protein
MEVVLAKTAEVMEQVYAEYDKLAAECEEKEKEEKKEEEGEEKIAGVTVQDCLDAHAELTLKKQAGELSEEDFVKEAALVKDVLDGLTKTAAAAPAPEPAKPTALDKIKGLKRD